MPSLDSDRTDVNSRPCRVSFVVTTRNDDHGGDMARRTSIFIEGLLQLANKHRLQGELIIVEWNSPSGPRLHEALQVQTKSDLFAIRFIEVPNKFHHDLRNADVIPLFQYIAKNVGIRRANGEFIIATNPDLLFSEDLIAFLASGDLSSSVMYRIDRTDVRADVPSQISIENQLSWCDSHILRIHRKFGTFLPGTWLVSRFKIRKIASNIFRVILQVLHPLPTIHTNGCGDFTMLSGERWHRLRGYPELPIWSMHLDSLLCYMAIASGLTEQVLRSPARMYHLEHGSSWVVMTPEDRLRTFAKKPWIDSALLREIWEHMYIKGEPMLYNSADWGLGGRALPETVVVSGKMKTLGVTRPEEVSV